MNQKSTTEAEVETDRRVHFEVEQRASASSAWTRLTKGGLGGHLYATRTEAKAAAARIEPFCFEVRIIRITTVREVE